MGRRPARSTSGPVAAVAATRHPIRSAMSLLIIALGLGLALAASLGVVIWLISAALQSASTT